MKAYAWKDCQFVSGAIVKIISEDGFLLSAYEVRGVSTKVKETAYRWAKDYDVEWLDRPWKNDGFNTANRLYEHNHFIRLDCREF